ncbi:AAA family ATPase [Actinomadura verrucosospora]|uniref:Cell division protein FtsK n=1 Tax=Actinomadura verrucosospora TaxID=46165 RepID=A0A7D4A7X8_ACTVE|nr:AAA family ATPase [Actinomadura verrucosospora]QKG23347.1 cell division protein FtsK [Actinomadura verrucosospora]
MPTAPNLIVAGSSGVARKLRDTGRFSTVYDIGSASELRELSRDGRVGAPMAFMFAAGFVEDLPDAGVAVLANGLAASGYTVVVHDSYARRGDAFDPRVKVAAGRLKLSDLLATFEVTEPEPAERDEQAPPRPPVAQPSPHPWGTSQPPPRPPAPEPGPRRPAAGQPAARRPAAQEAAVQEAPRQHQVAPPGQYAAPPPAPFPAHQQQPLQTRQPQPQAPQPVGGPYPATGTGPQQPGPAANGWAPAPQQPGPAPNGWAPAPQPPGPAANGWAPAPQPPGPAANGWAPAPQAPAQQPPAPPGTTVVPAAAVAARQGRIIAIASAKGGVGKTSATVNLAAYAARILKAAGRPGTAVIVDTNFQQADVARYLDLQTPTVLDLLRSSGALTAETVRGQLAQVPEIELYALLGPPDAVNADPARINSALYRRILTVLRQAFDYVFVDTPVAELYHVTFTDLILPEADAILVPVEPNRVTLETSRSWLKAITMPQHVRGGGVDPRKLGLILNRARADVDCGPEEVMDLLPGWRFVGMIPEDQEWMQAVNARRLTAMHAGPDLQATFRDILEAVTDDPVFGSAPIESQSKSLWRSLLGLSQKD